MMDGRPIARTLGRLKTLRPHCASRAEGILSQVSKQLAASTWTDVAFEFSTLTNTGYPVEFAWTSRNADLRFTMEVASAETEEHQRLDIARSLLSNWRAGNIPAVEVLARMQKAAPLKFGAWIGVRCAEDRNAFKLYGETPECSERTAWIASMAKGAGLVFDEQEFEWRMAGLDENGGIELYAHLASPDMDRLPAFLKLLHADPDVFVKQLRMLVRQDDLPDVSGISFAFDATGALTSLTVFVFAKHIYANDQLVEDAVLLCANPDTPNKRHYQLLCSGQADGRWRHGMLGLGIMRGGHMWMQAGIRPS
jgi:hypothetical protein